MYVHVKIHTYTHLQRMSMHQLCCKWAAGRFSEWKRQFHHGESYRATDYSR